MPRGTPIPNNTKNSSGTQTNQRWTLQTDDQICAHRKTDNAARGKYSPEVARGYSRCERQREKAHCIGNLEYMGRNSTRRSKRGLCHKQLYHAMSRGKRPKEVPTKKQTHTRWRRRRAEKRKDGAGNSWDNGCMERIP